MAGRLIKLAGADPSSSRFGSSDEEPLDAHPVDEALDEGLDSLTTIRQQLRLFRSDRQWEQFHTPRNLALSLVVECGELLEHFQWLDDAEIYERLSERREAVAEEIADVVIYAVQLADVLEVSLPTALQSKMITNGNRYPLDRSRGKSTKHTELSRKRSQ
jgi:dCTP diphosphatase